MPVVPPFLLNSQSSKFINCQIRVNVTGTVCITSKNKFTNRLKELTDETASFLIPSFGFGFKMEIVPWSTHRSPCGLGLEIALRRFPKTHWNVTGMPVWTVPGENDDGPGAYEEIAADQYRTFLSFVKTPRSITCLVRFHLCFYRTRSMPWRDLFRDLRITWQIVLFCCDSYSFGL